MRPIGKNIRDLRTKKNITQEALAEKLFVTRQTISNYETGRSQPDVETLLKIADALGVDANTLIYGPPKPPVTNRRAAYIRMAVGGTIFAVLLIAVIIVVPIVEDYSRHTFDLSPALAVMLLLFPALRLVGGWCVLHALGLLLKFEPPKWRFSPYVRWALMILLAVYLASVAAYFLAIEVLGTLTMFAEVISAPALFAIQNQRVMAVICVAVGAAFWIFGLPRRRSPAPTPEQQKTEP